MGDPRRRCRSLSGKRRENVTAATPPTVGHVSDDFLTLTETFIYTVVTHQREFTPVVLAGERSNAELFPFEPVHLLRRERPSAPARIVDKLRARTRGFPSAMQWRMAQIARRSGC